MAGTKRTYVDATKNEDGTEAQSRTELLRGLQDIVKGLESQKRRKI